MNHFNGGNDDKHFNDLDPFLQFGAQWQSLN